EAFPGESDLLGWRRVCGDLAVPSGGARRRRLTFIFQLLETARACNKTATGARLTLDSRERPSPFDGRSEICFQCPRRSAWRGKKNDRREQARVECWE